MPHGHLLAPLLLLLLTGCRKPQAELTVKDCGADFNCLIERARGCQPATVLIREQQPPAEGEPESVLARYEVVGRLQGRCHVSRTRVEPPPPPPPEPEPTWVIMPREEVRPVIPAPRPDRPLPPQLQCLYPLEQVAGVLRRVEQHVATVEDLAPCYPGDGSCKHTPLPLLEPGCAPGDCLASRWTFTCQYPGERDIHACEGTRLSDENPTCFLGCRHGQFHLNCRKPKKGTRSGLDAGTPDAGRQETPPR